MTIQAGDKIPECTMKTMGSEGPTDITTGEIFDGKKVVLFAVPGAFTPGCSMTHLPGYVVNADKIKAKGVDTIACMAVNDPFVMEAWGKDQHVGDKVLMLADGSAKFAKALGLELDLNEMGLGTRSQRFAMIVEDGTVTQLMIDPAGEFDASSAESVLEKL